MDSSLSRTLTALQSGSYALMSVMSNEATSVAERSSMVELLRTNNPVTLSFIEALLRDADINFQLLDMNMSVMEGNLGILQRRILVDDDQLAQAERLLVDAGLADELPGKKS